MILKKKYVFMNRKDVIGLLNSRSLSPLKKLGQNFLWNSAITSQIAAAAEIKENESVIEIGPGLGALSDELAKLTNDLTLVELDKGLFSFLSEKYASSSIKLVHSDFLKYESSTKYNKAVSNLPYYCASEILFKIIEDYHPEIIVIMLQKEMAERILSHAGDDSYGALTASVSLLYNAENVMSVAADNFYPEPDVKSAVLKLIRKNADYSKEEREMFRSAVKSAFWGRRKRILKSLTDSPHMSIEKNTVMSALEKSDIDPNKRAEEISPEEFMKIARALIEKQ